MSQDQRRAASRRPRPDGSAVPPSFAPDNSAPRPDPRGARPVGDRGATRAMPASRPAAPEGRPRTPERRSLRPAAEQSPAQQSAATRQPSGASPAAAPPAYAPRTTTPGEPPDGPLHRTQPAPPAAPERRRRGRRRRGRRALAVVAVLLVVLLAWPVGLLIWANGQINHVPALSDAPATPGTTYLIAGSDSRADGAAGDDTAGERADTIMLLHRPESGPAALVSLPRDTVTEIPGHGQHKLNSAYAFGGPELLVQTTQGLTGLTVDHYVEIGMAGVRDIVDAVGGVELCLDYDVEDWRSDLVWEAGCHQADGDTALAFARMRYADPEGDIGRTARQRQLVSSIISEATAPATLLNPLRQVEVIDSALSSIVVDEDTGIIDLARMALAFRAATGTGGLVGPPPIADYNYQPGGIGSTVLLDPDLAPEFFARLRDGELTEADFE